MNDKAIDNNVCASLLTIYEDYKKTGCEFF